MTPQQEARIAEALRHVEMGFAVMSVWSTNEKGVCRCVKGKDCTSPGKHPVPPNGFLAASRDPAIVTKMLSAPSEPNYGIVWPIVEGANTGVVVLDVDGADWHAKIDDLKAQFGPLPPTKTTRTPSGGLHLFYQWPPAIPVPDRNTLHGFVSRFPWKGYVVGPGSRINGSTYTAVGPAEIATLPEAWAGNPGTSHQQPLITTEEIKPPYELPAGPIGEGGRHDEVTKFVASLWNRRVPKDQVETLVRTHLLPLFDPQPDEAKLRRDLSEAWDTAAKKWGTPGAAGPTVTLGAAAPSTAEVTSERIEVGLLPSVNPASPLAMRPEAFSTSTQIGLLLDHFTPRTDAGFEGLTMTSLVYLGALMGHTPSCFYGSREQHANVFAMLVGTTGASRKGTTVDLVRSALAQCTDGVRGLRQSPNSGEGLIALAAKAEGAPILVEEEEFARFITAKSREGSTLSSILRQSFDNVPLSSATAARIVRADVHHIAMLGNVTREEIAEGMARIDLKNGFANRIAWTGVFPRPVSVTIHDNALPGMLVDSIRDAIEWANKLTKPLIGGTTHQIEDAARALLASAADRYTAGVGMAPFLARRLDTIAARLALVYACLDWSRTIAVRHVEAALAVTDYARESASWLFPETTGDVDADLVLRHLRAAGFLNTREIEALVGKRPRDKQHVADLLMLMGYARLTERPRRDGRPGRPARGLELTS